LNGRKAKKIQKEITEKMFRKMKKDNFIWLVVNEEKERNQKMKRS
jgi:hypothetical protein